MTPKRQTLINEVRAILSSNQEGEFCVEASGLFYKITDLDLPKMKPRLGSKGIRRGKPKGQAYLIKGIKVYF